MLIIGLEKISRTQFVENCPLGYGLVFFFCYIMVLAKAEQCVDALANPHPCSCSFSFGRISAILVLVVLLSCK
jgi:hypothetical protein